MKRAFAFLLLMAATAWGQTESTTPGEFRQHATLHSVGLEWDIAGDSDHDATCQVKFRRQGAAEWNAAMDLFRVDYKWWYADKKADAPINRFAGSVLFLTPGTAYEIHLSLKDPDGGAAEKVIQITTRAVPKLPKGGRQLHVKPGAGGGTGTEADPFLGLPAADKAAQPGDILTVHPGNYGIVEIGKAGEPGRYVAWKAEPGAILNELNVKGSHVWIEGFQFRRANADRGNALKAREQVHGVAVVRNDFQGFHYSITLRPTCQDWYIADNTIVGDNDPNIKGNAAISGEGVELGHSDGHVVCYNRISRVADGVSYCNANCDIFGNDIFDVSDDGLEPDYGFANNRMWGNRLTNCQHAAFSFQPMKCGPWYFIRNQVISGGYLFKFRVQDRYVFANNTFVTWNLGFHRMHHLLTSFSRNNLYIAAGSDEKQPYFWVAYSSKETQYTLPDVYQPYWKTDVDYDGFDWADAKEPFRWNNNQDRYPDLASFAAGVGIEKHAIRVDKAAIFETFNVPPQRGRVEPDQVLALKTDGNAIDAGAVVPNVNDRAFEGKAPDLGAHESGKPAAKYGPREKAADDPWALY